MDDLQLGRLLATGFSTHQVGSIASYVEPLTEHDDLFAAEELFRRHPEVSALPVESADGVYRVVERRTVERRRRGILRLFQGNELGPYLSSAFRIVDARERLDLVLDIAYSGGQELIPHYLVFHRGRFFGIVELVVILKHVFQMRKVELERAREIQQHLISAERWDEVPYRVYIHLDMAYELGGDFYFHLPLGDNRELIACFDVSGKNISAALSTGLIASFFSTLQVENRIEQMSGIDLAMQLNRVLFLQTPADMFVASILVFVDRGSRTLQILNHGYSSLYMIEDGTVIERESEFLPLGIEEDLEFDGPVQTIPLQEGQILFSYSDGLPDAQNVVGAPYGEKRVREFVNAHAHLGGEQFMNELKREIGDFIEDAPRSDDITAIVVHFVDCF